MPRRRRRRPSLEPAARPALVVHCDGLCEPRNPGGVACYGYVARRGDQVIASGWGVVARGPQATNNVAEYAAAIYALRALLDLGLSSDPVEVRSDSELLVNQMRGIYAVRSPRIASLHGELQRLARRFREIRWRWVPREENTEADALSRRAYAEAVLAEKAKGAAGGGPGGRRSSRPVQHREGLVPRPGRP
jgi:ribonuclease HI